MATSKFNLSKSNEPKASKFNLTKEQSAPSAPKRSEPKKFKWWLWLLILVILIVIVIFALKKSSTNNNDATEITQVEQPSAPTHDVDNAAPETAAAGNNESTVSPATEEQTVTPSGESAPQTAPIPYNQGEAYKVYQFPFGDGSYSKPDPELDKLAKVLAENPDGKIQIYAYTDKVGSAEFNQALSAKRAKAIYDYLVSQGVDKSRLSYQGKGISTKYGSDAENRRAEFIIK
jgi:outer membrane protein OmpA-like peptidoglycan-associated protein